MESYSAEADAAAGGEPWSISFELKESQKLSIVIVLSVFSTLIEVVGAIILSSNIIFANVIDGSYEVILLYINYRGMLHEENGRKKKAKRFANLTDCLLIFGCLFVLCSSWRAYHNPIYLNGAIITLISGLSVIVNVIAMLLCPSNGYNGRSAFIKVIGGTGLVSIGFLGGIMVYFGWSSFDALAGGFVAAILAGFVIWNLIQRRKI